MAWYHYPPGQVRQARAPAPERRDPVAENPFSSPKVRSGFFSTDVSRLLSGWDTQSSSIDSYLRDQLAPLRARSREMVRKNPYGKRFIAAVKSNVVGHSGITIQAQSMIQRRTSSRPELDTLANDAIETAFKDWAQNHADYSGKNTWEDLQALAIACAAQDGEFIFKKHKTGRYGLQLECIDPELLDVTKNHKVPGGGHVRLGVEYDGNGAAVRYWFRKRDDYGNYSGESAEPEDAANIIHGFISEWPNQSRGIPWMHASLERSKHLEKYEESAIVKARSTAATMAVLRSPDGDAYEGDEDYGDGVTLDQFEAGTIKDIGNREITHLDSDYPHQMYASFVKAHLQGIASGLGISYHTLANDLEGVNYSSIRAGVLEDREIWKGIQNWLIRQLMRPVYVAWIRLAMRKGVIRIGQTPLNRPVSDYYRVHFQPRRWAWVDPQKDSAANEIALKNRLKSYSQIMREQGDDPDSVWREIERDIATMKELGITPIEQKQEVGNAQDPE